MNQIPEGLCFGLRVGEVFERDGMAVGDGNGDFAYAEEPPVNGSVGRDVEYSGERDFARVTAQDTARDLDGLCRYNISFGSEPGKVQCLCDSQAEEEDGEESPSPGAVVLQRLIPEHVGGKQKRATNEDHGEAQRVNCGPAGNRTIYEDCSGLRPAGHGSCHTFHTIGRESVILCSHYWNRVFDNPDTADHA